MSLLVKDSLSGKMVEVGENGEIGLYVCGPTVYDHIHIGNARAPLFWDVVARYLRSRGYDVTFVQNITDIEDKIINKANEEGVSWQEIVDRYTDSFHERLRDARHRAARHRAARHRAHPRDDLPDRRAHREGPRVRPRGSQRRRLLRGRELPALRRPEPPASRRDARDGEGPDRLQEEPAGLRAVEGLQTGRAFLGEPLGRQGVLAGTSSAPRW